jgi:tetratricopeptide (TPR) repeat protein
MMDNGGEKNLIADSIDLTDESTPNMADLKSLIDSGEATIKDIVEYGLMLHTVGHSDESLMYLNRFINSSSRADFDGMEAFLTAHSIYRAKGDIKRAVSVLKDNEIFLKDKSEYYCCLGFCYKDDFDDVNTALSYFKNALHCKGNFINSNLPPQKNNNFYYFIPYYALGQCQIKQRRFDIALRYLKKSMEYGADENVRCLIQKLERFLYLANLIKEEDL